MIGQKRLDTNSQFDERHEIQQDKKIVSIDNRVTALEQQGGIVVDDDFSTTSTNPVENKVITVKMETIESDVNSINGRLTNVESDITEKSEMYTIEINSDNKMTHDGTLLSFSDVREKCLDNSYFVYLTYENNLYIPGCVTATEVFFDSVQTVLSEITVKRVVINESENVIFTSYDIAKKSDVQGVKYFDVELTETDTTIEVPDGLNYLVDFYFHNYGGHVGDSLTVDTQVSTTSFFKRILNSSGLAVAVISYNSDTNEIKAFKSVSAIIIARIIYV